MKGGAVGQVDVGSCRGQDRQVAVRDVHVRSAQHQGVGTPGHVQTVDAKQLLIAQVQATSVVQRGIVQVRDALPGEVRVPHDARVNAVKVESLDGPVCRLYVERRESIAAPVGRVRPDGDVHHAESPAALTGVEVGVVDGDGHFAGSDVFDEQVFDPEVHGIFHKQRTSCVSTHLTMHATNITRIGFHVVGPQVVDAGLLSSEDSTLAVVGRGQVAQFHAPSVFHEQACKAVAVKGQSVNDHFGGIDAQAVFVVVAEVPIVSLHGPTSGGVHP